MAYHVYLVLCQDGSYYCGQTNNLQRRLSEHAARKVKYTRMKGAVEMRVIRKFWRRGKAMRFENVVKRMHHREKRALFWAGEKVSPPVPRKGKAR